MEREKSADMDNFCGLIFMGSYAILVEKIGGVFMPYFGCHLSNSKGNMAMVNTARSIGANTFAFFTRNPRGSKAKPEDPADCAKAVAALKEFDFGPLVAHGSYTMNLCTADPEARAFAAEILEDDLRRMAALPGNFYNFHSRQFHISLIFKNTFYQFFIRHILPSTLNI